MKEGRQKLIMVRVLMHSIEMAAIILNIAHLLVICWTQHKYIDFYNVVNNLFLLPDLNNIIRYKIIVWNTYIKLPIKINGVLCNEKYAT